MDRFGSKQYDFCTPERAFGSAKVDLVMEAICGRYMGTFQWKTEKLPVVLQKPLYRAGFLKLASRGAIGLDILADFVVAEQIALSEKFDANLMGKLCEWSRRAPSR